MGEELRVDSLSSHSLLLKPRTGDQTLSRATGFVVETQEEDYLITNWHVLSGRHPQTGQTLHADGEIPTRLTVIHHHARGPGEWIEATEELYDQGNPRWVEHPEGNQVDLVALPLESAGDADIQLYPLDLELADADMVPVPAMRVSIIGFPMGYTAAGSFPIWKTGHVASDPDLDYEGLPCFLVDATTRPGMSGSPVIVRLSGGFKTEDDGFVLSQGGYTTKFLGVFSGQIDPSGQSEISQVWKPRVIREILP